MGLVVGLVASCSGSAAASTPPRLLVFLTQVSGSGSKTTCPTTGATTPQLAIDPSNPEHEVATWEVGKGAAEYLGMSDDAGRTWNRHPLAGVTPCSGGSNGSVVDPYVGMGDNGLVVATSSWNLNGEGPAIGNGVNHVLVNRSLDGGLTSTTASELESSQPDQRAPVVVEPDDPSHVLIATERIQAVAPGSTVPGLDASVAVLRSTNGGRTFGAPVTVSAPLPGTALVTGGMVWTPRAIVLVVSEEDLTQVLGPILQGEPHVEHMVAYRSTNDGASFSGPYPIGIFNADTISLTTTLESDPGCCIQDLAAGPNGTVALAWPDQANGEIHLARSNDGGVTWTSSVAATAPHGALLPAVTVLPDGRAAVLFDDRWTADGNALAQPYIAVTGDADHEPFMQALDSPFNISAITDGNDDTGPLGPEQDIAAVRGGVRALFTYGEPHGDVEVWQASVPIP
jgi:hypothetical protein